MTPDTPPSRRSRKWLLLLLVALALLGGGLFVAHELREDRIRRNEEYAIQRLLWESKSRTPGAHNSPMSDPAKPAWISRAIFSIASLFGLELDDAATLGNSGRGTGSGYCFVMTRGTPADSAYEITLWNEFASHDVAMGYCFRIRQLYLRSNSTPLIADPLEEGSTGRRSFFINQNGIVRWTQGRRATSTDPVVED